MVEHPLQDANAESADVLLTVRVILGAVLEPGVAMTVPAIAEATGLTVEAVRHAMSSAPYRAALEGEAMNLLSHSLTRGIKKMDSLVHGDKVSDTNRVAAFRAIVSTYQAVQLAKPKARDVDADLEDFLKDLGKPKPPQIA
jgi:hypothetical protein